MPVVDGKSPIVLSITGDSGANWPGIAEQAVAIANRRIERTKHAAVS